ncbi:MAG: hypothetical protein R3C26_00090 [Calditrichia bacterium]
MATNVLASVPVVKCFASALKSISLSTSAKSGASPWLTTRSNSGDERYEPDGIERRSRTEQNGVIICNNAVFEQANLLQAVECILNDFGE